VTASAAAALLLVTAGACTSEEEPDYAAMAAAEFLEAWESGDVGAAAAATDDPAAASERLTEVQESLGATVAALEPGVVTRPSEQPDDQPGTATVPVDVTLSLEPLGDWSYATALPVVETAEEDVWTVDWSPAVVHPQLTEETSLVRRRTLPDRAPILGRDGQELMTQRPVVAIGVEPRRLTDPQSAYDLLAETTGIDPEALAARVEEAQPNFFVPVIVLRVEEFEELRAELADVPGLVLREETRTLAPTATFARGVLGTVEPATAETLAAAGPLAEASDDIGASGLQQQFQLQLAGEPTVAVLLVEQDGGEVVETLHDFPGQPGEPLRTTLDYDVQAAAEQALAGLEQPASLVALQPSTGEVLAAANAPATSANPAFTGRYPPGSTFKVVTTAALLGQDLEPDDIVPCPPTATVQGRVFGNAGDFALGEVPFRTDFAQSCNTAFVNLSRDLAPDALAEQGIAFGVGGDWEMSVPAFTGSVPVVEDPVARAAAAIGQGEVLTSPLGMAAVAATVQAGGFHPPVLLADPGDGATATPSAPDPGPGLEPAVATQLEELMRQVVVSGSGDALADVPGPEVMAKTGTAEYGTEDPPRTHAWIIGYVGDLAFSVIVEDGGGGGAVAGPVAAQFLTSLEDLGGPDATDEPAQPSVDSESPGEGDPSRAEPSDDGESSAD
jgi:cell division protein FtsI/penicillin-binding protein 2